MNSFLLLLFIESSDAAQFEPLGQSVEKVLGTSKAKTRMEKIDGEDIRIFAKEGKGSTQYACVATGLYPPDCTHTWTIGVDAKKTKITQIRPVEMSCHHAYPTKDNAWFYKQFIGKGMKELADFKKLSFRKVVKATGTSELTGKGVARCLEFAAKLRKEAW